MRPKSIGVLLAATLLLGACGAEGRAGRLLDPDGPLIQVRSEGGLVPMEYKLGRGPAYTLLGDGRLIHEGPVIAIYPGPLLPNLQVARISGEQIDSVFALVERIGLPEMDHELDDRAARIVADASTETVTYWDSLGEHSYSVYALGIEPGSASRRNQAFLDLLTALDQFASESDAVPYRGDRVRVMAGVGGWIEPEFEDIREWPLDDTDFSDWRTLDNGWMCKMHPPEVLGIFGDASQATQWLHPNPMMDAPNFSLQVRPLHPGETDCPER